MIEASEISNKINLSKEIKREDKFKILQSKKIDSTVVEYLMQKLSNLYIEILEKDEGLLFDLMVKGKLEGWCWQTTESAIIFFNDDDYIERGVLKIDAETPEYYHSWICFKFDDIEYIFDPCLNFLCQKNDYSKIFKVEVKGKVSAKEVREELIRQITAIDANENRKTPKEFKNFLKIIMGKSYNSYMESKESEVMVYASEDVNTPLYRNGSGYKIEMENAKVKKLTVHYYSQDY